jgi:hypothetical protein
MRNCLKKYPETKKTSEATSEQNQCVDHSINRIEFLTACFLEAGVEAQM